MTPAFRVKLALLAIGSLLATTFAWNAAQGQNWPRPPNDGGGGANLFTCPNCGYIYRGAVPPAVCPACKMRMGGGAEGPGDAPVGRPPVIIPPPPKEGEAVLRTSKSSGFFSFSRKQVVIGAVVGGSVVMVVAALAGGAFLVIYTMRKKNPSPVRRRRPRQRDDYDDD